jgi:hypothetical protein
MLKEGVIWDDVHLKAHEIAIEGLLKLGILQGTKEDILKTRTSVAFFPHGLGHYLGMDTHDTGGHPNYEDKDPMFRYLRVRGALPAGSIITVEPGVSVLSLLVIFAINLTPVMMSLLTLRPHSRFTSAASSSNPTSPTRCTQHTLTLRSSISTGLSVG